MNYPAPPPPPPGPFQAGPPPQAPGKKTPWGLIIGIVVAVVLVAGIAIGGFFALRGGDDETSAKDDESSESTDATDAPTTEASSEPSTSTSPSTVAVDRSAVLGTWEGVYDCAQGSTGLRLDVEAGEGPTGIKAVFHFRKTEGNPTVPTGSYHMEGELEDGRFNLRRGGWIERPDGFITVGLVADLTEAAPTMIRGRVRGPGCTSFTIERP